MLSSCGRKGHSHSLSSVILCVDAEELVDQLATQTRLAYVGEELEESGHPSFRRGQLEAAALEHLRHPAKISVLSLHMVAETHPVRVAIYRLPRSVQYVQRPLPTRYDRYCVDNGGSTIHSVYDQLAVWVCDAGYAPNGGKSTLVKSIFLPMRFICAVRRAISSSCWSAA